MYWQCAICAAWVDASENECAACYGPKDHCTECGEPIALYDNWDDPVCDCETEAEQNELKRRLEKYEAREQADKETLHEFTEALAYRRKLKEEG